MRKKKKEKRREKREREKMASSSSSASRSSARLLLSTSALSAYRALRRSLRASDIEDQGLVKSLSSEFRRILREEEEGKAGKKAPTSTSTKTSSSSSSTSLLARDFAFLLDAVRHQRDLLLSYDIGVDRDTRQMETVRRTAARVGLRLPEKEEGEK